MAQLIGSQIKTGRELSLRGPSMATGVATIGLVSPVVLLLLKFTRRQSTAAQSIGANRAANHRRDEILM